MSKRDPRERNDSDKPETSPGESPPNEPVPRIPSGARRLKKGDRVSFDIGEGVDGPPYAMNVRLVDED